jgi:prepilin-type N-terminal cleavage/methylation domain-containing protein
MEPCICTDLHGRPVGSRGVVAHAVRDRCDVFRGHAPVTTPDTRYNSPDDTTLADPSVRERGLLNQVTMDARRFRVRPLARARSAHGFSLIEMLMVVAILAVMSGVAIGVSQTMVRNAKGQAGAQQLAGFLKRTKEMAVSRRRNIEVSFAAPNVVTTQQRAVPNPPAATPAPTPLETLRLEGNVEFRTFAIGDTPDLFASATPPAINVGATLPVLFTSEGQFVDANGDPVNATLFLGQPGQISTANALTILGTTSLIRMWRWDGSRWVQ